MRSRFFFTILSVLLFVTVSSLYFYSLLLRKERVKLIDRQIRQIASSLIDAETGEMRRIDFDKSDAILSEELGKSQGRKFFVIRNNKGDVQFESTSASDLPLEELSVGSQWFDYQAMGVLVRGLNLKLPNIRDRTLQVGLILDPEIFHADYFTATTAIFILVIVLVGFLTSYLLTNYLLKPISKLDTFLSEVVSISNLQQILPAIPSYIAGKTKVNSKDEFERVVVGLSALITKVNRNYQFSRQWGYQMAHELKTPLSLLVIGFERLQKRNNISDESLIDVRTEIGKVSDTISSFLDWAELENSQWHKHLNVNHISEAVHGLIRRLPVKSSVKLNFENELIVSAKTSHLEQLLQNLIQNALKHTAEGTSVKVELFGRSINVVDKGPGMSATVLERMGEPFNKGNHHSLGQKGHGLGLAWVTSICRIYGWKLDFTSTSSGLTVTVRFDNDSIIQPYLNPSASL